MHFLNGSVQPEVVLTLGIILGVGFTLITLWVSRSMYRQTLVQIAKDGGVERLPDGNFYALVHAKQYREMQLELTRFRFHAVGKPMVEKATKSPKAAAE